MNFYFSDNFFAIFTIFWNTIVKNAIIEVKMPKTMIDFDKDFYYLQYNICNNFIIDIEGSMNFVFK